MASTTEVIEARDGVGLLVRGWPSGSGEAWASALLLHGLAEHSGRYEHVGGYLAAAGLDAHALDLRGFGLSGGPRASIARWSQLYDDVEDILRLLRERSPDVPLVLYGHSLGGFVALGYGLEGGSRPRPDLLVLSAPAIDASIPLWQRLLVRVLGRVAPGVMLANRIDPTTLSSDPEVHHAYRSDPLNVHRTSAGFALAAFHEQRRVLARLDGLEVPTLVIHGGADRLVPTTISAPLDRVPAVTRRVYPSVQHELHNEPEGEAVLADVVSWIRDRLGQMDYDARTTEDASGERDRAESVERPQTRRT